MNIFKDFETSEAFFYPEVTIFYVRDDPNGGVCIIPKE
jgi:hypothetical protein